MGRLRVAVCCVAVLVSLVGCTNKKSPGASSSSGPAARAWAITDLRPIGQVASADGVAVGYVRDGKSLLLVGIDPAKGTLLWRQRAALSRITPGIAIVPKVIDQHIVYFRAGTPGVHTSADV